MKKIVVIPVCPISSYLKNGLTYDFFENYYNPGDFFDEVYCICPGEKNIKRGKINYMNVDPQNFEKVISDIKPDLIRAYGGFGCSDWAAANLIKDIPLVISVHDTNPNLINQSLKFADYIICMTNEVKKSVQKQIDIPKDRIFILPNRVDIAKFYRRSDKKMFTKLDLEYGKGKHIIHVGRKVEQKNLDTLIRALTYLPEMYTAIFIGSGNTQPYKNIAKKYNVEERCFFVDHIINSELPMYYSWADCLCTPSRWEGFGIIFIEAAACECPIVASNIAPINEYLSHGVNSWLVDDYENAEILSKAIVDACSKNEKALSITRNARKTAMKFNKTFVDNMEQELYKKFITTGTDNDKLNKLILEIEKLQKKIIVWGAGTIGRRLALSIGHNRVAFFVDSDKRKIGTIIDGIKVISYADLLKIYKNYNIVVSPLNRAEITSQLIQEKIKYMEAGWFTILNQKYANK